MHIINLSIQQNVVPNDLKNARLVPLFKKNKRSEVGNYRPVSVLFVVSKILLEMAVYTQFEECLVKKKLLFDFQSGFNSNFSIDSCLTYLTDYIETKTSKGLYTGMPMLDLQKAFDTVHHILCKKLKAMSIKSVDCFKSYLSHRNQILHVNDTESDPSLVTYGVPQGSILGPLLFRCYINDMGPSISPESKLLLYADDSAILYSHKNPKVISGKKNLAWKVLEMGSK